eukprot:2630804-Rhodomonas_salina.10
MDQCRRFMTRRARSPAEQERGCKAAPHALPTRHAPAAAVWFGNPADRASQHHRALCSHRRLRRARRRGRATRGMAPGSFQLV